MIAGQGYESGGIEELATVLRAAGYDVTTSQTIPTSLEGIGQLWWYDYRPFPEADVDRLVQYVRNGGGLYLTGERPCCEDLNGRASAVVNDLVAANPVQVGGLGDPFYGLGPVPTNPDATDALTSEPFTVTEVVMDAPGGMSGVAGANALATAPDNQIPVAAAWNASDLTSTAGRLVVVMDVNWLDPSRKGSQADDLAQNLALFLSGSSEPPTAPADTLPEAATVDSEPESSVEPHPTTSGAAR